MDNKKQKLLLEYLVNSSDTFAICQGIVQPQYFDPELRTAVSFIKKYFDEYNTTPDANQIRAEAGVDVKETEVSKDQIEYTTNEIETFCRRKALEQAVMNSPKLIAEGNYAAFETEVRDAVTISLHRNLGLRYFENPEERLKRMLEEDPVESTGWDELDELLFGGISRKEMVLVSANSGGGKSITLANLGLNFLLKKHNVLYISLELSEDVVAQRFDTMFTGISRKNWKSHISEITTRLANVEDEAGILDIVQMKSGTTANDIRAYLKEYYLHYGYMPDFLILDYLDKMFPNQKIDMSDVWTKDKLVSEQLRDIAVEFNMFLATASQLNREAVKATHHDHSHIAGGISKINESDTYWSITMTETMKAAGEIAFTLQKTRNSDGVGKMVYLRWDGSHLRILNRDNNDGGGLTFKPKSSLKDDPLDLPKEGGNNLLDLMTSLS